MLKRVSVEMFNWCFRGLCGAQNQLGITNYELRRAVRSKLRPAVRRIRLYKKGEHDYYKGEHDFKKGRTQGSPLRYVYWMMLMRQFVNCLYGGGGRFVRSTKSIRNYDRLSCPVFFCQPFSGQDTGHSFLILNFIRPSPPINVYLPKNG